MLTRLYRLLYRARANRLPYYLYYLLKNHGAHSLLRYIRYVQYFKQAQDHLLKKTYASDTKSLIVFLTPGFDVVNGGILSITSIFEETKKLKNVHNAETIMCTIPGDPLLLRYTKFNNHNYIYRLSQVISYFQNLENIMIHIPEYCVYQFLRNISTSNYLRIKKIKNVHFNVLLQNIKLLSSLIHINKLRKLGTLTCTTAHEKYSTREIRDKLGFPLHKLSWYLSTEQYDHKPYFEKEDLMIVSPDTHERKSEVLRSLAEQFPNLHIQIVKNLTYTEYKEAISRAKWALTFGEGLDGYFIETIFSGGISFSVNDPAFFTDDFKALRTVYDNYDVLITNICADIQHLDDETSYIPYHRDQYDLLCKYFKYEEYVRNIRLYYEKKYTYP